MWIKCKYKFLNADHPLRFINNVIKKFSQESSEMVDLLTLRSLFEILKKVVLVEIPYCPENDGSSKWFIKKFDEVIWYTDKVGHKKMKQLFKHTMKNLHLSCVM